MFKSALKRSLLPALRGLAALLAAATAATCALADTAYPSRPVRVVVPFPAGTAPDVAARYWSDRMAKALQQPFIVDNRAGAATIVGTQAVTASAADGYTLLYTASGTVTINPFVYKKLPYKTSDLVPVTQMLLNPLVISVPAQSPFASIGELIKAAKAKPGEVTYASYGVGTVPHMAMAYFASRAGLTMNHVPYRDGGLTDVLSGMVDTAFSPIGDVLQYIKAGRIRPLAVSSPRRLESLPQVPTVAELFPGFEGDTWQGLFVLKGTPQPVIDTLARASSRITASDEYKAFLGQFGLVPLGVASAAFEQAIRSESRRWESVVEANHISLEP